MFKKYFLVLSTFCFLLFSTESYSQWTFAGFVTGAGGSPSISVIDQNTVAVFGGPNGSPQVFLSTNGGTTFTPITGTGLGTLELYCGWGSSATTLFAGNGGAVGGAGGNASYYMTTNGGTTWTTIGSTGGSGGFFNFIIFSRSNSQLGFAQSDPPNGTGQPYYVTVTSNGGSTWTPVTCPGVAGCIGSQNSCFMIDGQFFGFGLNGGAARAYVTTNGGTTWTSQSLGITGAFVSAVVFNDNKMNGLAATNVSLPNISRTTNGGTTWSSMSVSNTGITGYCIMKYIDGTNTAYFSGAAGAGGVIAKTTNNGANWTTQTTAGLTGINHIDFYRSGTTVYGYAVAGDGSVLKITDVVTGISDPITNTIPSEYALKQNYPNPFNPTTNITFSIPRDGNVSLKVYDILGNVVTLFSNNEFLKAGTYNVEFDGSNMSSGIYFYTLSTDEFVETKKMMLTK